MRQTKKIGSPLIISNLILIFIVGCSVINNTDALKDKIDFVPSDLTKIEGGSFYYPYYQSTPFIYSYQDTATWNIIERQKIDFIQSFYIKTTEVTNKEYHEFVSWVRDSIARSILANVDTNYLNKGKLNWEKAIDWSDTVTFINYTYSRSFLWEI